MSWPADRGLHVIQSHLNLVFLATAMSSSSYRYNLITSTAYYRSYVSTLSSSYHTCQPYHHYIMRVNLAPQLPWNKSWYDAADQTNKSCRSNIGQDLGGMQSMSMVTTQPFVDCKRAVECQLTYSVFCIASKPLSARG